MYYVNINFVEVDVAELRIYYLTVLSLYTGNLQIS